MLQHSIASIVEVTWRKILQHSIECTRGRWFKAASKGSWKSLEKDAATLAWKASRRSLHRDHTSVLARDVQGAKATPNRGRERQGAQARKNWPPQLHENSQCFVTFQKELKMSGCISEKESGCISEKKLGCISDPHATTGRAMLKSDNPHLAGGEIQHCQSMPKHSKTMKYHGPVWVPCSLLLATCSKWRSSKWKRPRPFRGMLMGAGASKASVP